jgi:hypothetical protein
VKVGHNPALLAVLIFFTLVIVIGLGPFWIQLIFRNLFLFYTILVGSGLFLLAYVLSHFLSKLAAERRLLVRLVSWTLLALLFFSLTLFTLVYVFDPMEHGGYVHTSWSLTVPRDVFWTWFGIFPLNVMMVAIWLVGMLVGIVQEEPSFLGYAVARVQRKRILTLYVKSIRTQEEIGSLNRESAIASTLGPHYYRGTPMGDGDMYPVERFVLSEDQEQIIEIVKEKAFEQGFVVRIVDLTREEAHHRVEVIPTLITDSGKRLEGKISEQQLESLLAEA